MSNHRVTWFLSATALSVAFTQVHAQSSEDLPHRIIQGLRYDWPTAVICLKESDARSHFRLLRPQLSTYARLSPVPENNLLVATVSQQRMPVLLTTIAVLDRTGMAPSEAIKMLPSTYEKSLEQPEPKQPQADSNPIQGRYVPTHISMGRIAPYLLMYSEAPVKHSFADGAVLIEGDSKRIDAQMQLARAIDVADYDHCKEVNGT